MTKLELSVVILNYNTKELLEDCLESIQEYMHEVPLEVIVSDNSSNDGSVDMVRKKFPWVRLVEGPNEGFSRGNNRVRSLVNGKMVLFLNPDTVIHKNVFAKTAQYLKDNPEAGAVTCKLVLPNGKSDKDVRRRFPTPWISFSRLILGMNRQYWYEDVPDTDVQEVEAIQGAFFLTWKKILDKVDWFDEKYFFDGEDIDLCFQIHKLGYKLIYFPEVTVTHLKGVTKGKVREWKHKVSKEQRVKIRLAGVNSMERFFRKNLWNNYPVIFDYFVLLGIKLYKIIRFLSVSFLSE